MIEQFLIRKSVLGSVTNLLISAGTLSSNRSDVTFADLNGVSFGLNTNGVVTASVATGGGGGGAGTGFTTATTAGTNVVGTLSTNGLSMGVPAFLTTADLSQNSSKYAGTGFTTATTAGTNIVGTLNTAGISMGVPAYLTTAMQSNAATISNINLSAGTTSTNASAFTFSNLNNVSFGLGTGASAGVVTGSIATTYAGTGFTTATTAGTAIVGTLNTSGLSMGVPAFLTTAMQSNAATISNINVSAGTTSTNASAFTFSNVNNVSFGLGTGASAGNITGSIATTYAGTGFTTATTAGTAIVGTLNTSGLSMGVPAFLTTAMQSNAATISNINISAGTTSTNASAFTFANANGVSFGLGTGASVGSITGSIATTYAGTGFTSTTTAGTAIVGTLNTSGLSLGVPAYLTTADLSQNSSNYAGTNGAITGGSITVNTSGVSVNVPIATLSLFENLPQLISTSTSSPNFQSRIYVAPFLMPQPISIGFVRMIASMNVTSTSRTGTSANTSFTLNQTLSQPIVIYSQGTGASSLSLRYSTSTLASWVFQTSVTAGAVGSNYTVTFNITYPTQGTTSAFTTSYATTDTQYDMSTGSLTAFTGLKFVDIPFAVSLTPGNYWIGTGISTNTAQNGPAALNQGSINMSFVVGNQVTTAIGYPAAATNTSVQMVPGLGIWTTNSAVMSTSSMALGNISSDTLFNYRMYFQFIRQA